MAESLNKNRIPSFTSQAGINILKVISERFPDNDWKKLGKKLGLNDEFIDKLEGEKCEDSFKNENKLIRIVEKWNQMHNPKDNFIPDLKRALREINRKDIEQELNQIERRILGSLTKSLSEADWRKLGRHFNLSATEIEEINAKILSNDEKLFKMIEKSTDMKASNVRCLPIVLAKLRAIKRDDVVEDIKKVTVNYRKIKKIDAQSEAIRQLVTLKQKSTYKNIELLQLPWMEESLPLERLYVGMDIYKIYTNYEQNKLKTMKLTELFDNKNGKNALRILVEGGPGFGKTTFCMKLSHDWGENEAYVASKFKMLFFFELKYLKQNQTIEEMLQSECESIGFDAKDGISCIKAFESQTLLILDGFDEVEKDCKERIIQFLLKNEYPSMCIILTSRAGQFLLEKEGGISNVTSNIKDIHKSPKWDKKVLIEGIKEDQMTNFFTKYYQKDFTACEIQLSLISNQGLHEDSFCPFFVTLLEHVITTTNLTNVNSKTPIYKAFINQILRRNLIREKIIKVEDNVDIFNQAEDTVDKLNPSIKLWNELTIKLGKFFVECLRCKNKIFTENDIFEYLKIKNKTTSKENDNFEIIFRLGFLMNVSKLQQHQRQVFYQPINTALMQFIAAFAVCNSFENKKEKIETKITKLIDEGLKPNNDSLFYVFLGGLMNRKAYILFQVLIPFNLWFNTENNCFRSILLEIEDLDYFFPKFKNVLNKYIPCIHVIREYKRNIRHYFPSDIHSQILDFANELKLINIMSWHLKFSFKSSQILNYESLCLHFYNQLCDFEDDTKQIIKCDNILYKFTDEFMKENWNDVIKISNSIQSEKIHFQVEISNEQQNSDNSEFLEFLYKELKHGQWKNQNINQFIYHCNNNEEQKSLSLIKKFIVRRKITDGIRLWINKAERDEDELYCLKVRIESLFETVINSEIIKEFHFINEDEKLDPCFDFASFKRNSTCSFYSLLFAGEMHFKNIKSSDNLKNSIEELILYTRNETFSTIFEGIKFLSCDYKNFKLLMKNEKENMRDIEELELHSISPGLYNIDCILQLEHLQVLSLNFDSIISLPSVSHDSIIKLFSSLNLRICEFLYIECIEVFSFYVEVLLEGLLLKTQGFEKAKIEFNSVAYNSCKKDIHSLEELVISFKDYKLDYQQLQECLGINRIQSMLEKGQLKRSAWMYYWHDLSNPDKLQSLFPKSKNYTLTHRISGMNDSNSRWDKFWYRWFSLRDVYYVEYNN